MSYSQNIVPKWESFKLQLLAYFPRAYNLHARLKKLGYFVRLLFLLGNLTCTKKYILNAKVQFQL